MERTNQRPESAKTEQGRGARGALATPARPAAWPAQLQSRLGNTGVQRLMQARLTVSQPDDPYEQEAERVADRVMRMPASMANPAPDAVRDQASVQVRRACPTCEPELERQALPEEELLQAKAPAPADSIQRQAALEDDEQPLAAKVAARTLAREALPEVEPLARRAVGIDADGAVSDAVETALAGLAGRGQPLQDPVRADLEPRFGADFSAVRVHTDAGAHELARAVNAEAFTLGTDVVFGAGRYAPETATGRHLLAHELTHVVQQRQAPARSPVLRRQTLAQFRTDLETIGPDHATIVKALFAHPRFQPLVRFLNGCPAGTIEFGVQRIRQRVAGVLVDLFGGFSPGTAGSPAEMTVNPQRPEHATNPLEVADTVIHEFLHAILELRATCRSRTNPFPLAAGVRDLPHDPELAALRGVDSRTAAAAASAAGTTTNSGRDVREYMEEQYGPSASRPENFYVDLNREGLELVTGIIADLHTSHPTIGQETVSFDNVELLQAAAMLGTRHWLNAGQFTYSKGLFKDQVATKRKIDPATFTDREYTISAIQSVESADRAGFDPNIGNGWGPIGPVWTCMKRSRFTGKILSTTVTGTSGRKPGGSVAYRIVQHS